MMIDADLAELVDENGAVGIAGVGKDVAKQRRLARAEKAGDEVDRDRRRHRRLQPSRDSNAGSSGSIGRPSMADADRQTSVSVSAISRRPVALVRMKADPCQPSRRSANPTSPALAIRT